MEDFRVSWKWERVSGFYCPVWRDRVEPWWLLERGLALGTDPTEPVGLKGFLQHQCLYPASRIVQLSHYGASTPSSVKIFHYCLTQRTSFCLSGICSSKLAHCFSPFTETMERLFLDLFFNSGTFNTFKHLNLHSAFPHCCCFSSQVMLDPQESSCLHFPKWPRLLFPEGQCHNVGTALS